jgi:hypothetical protein
LKEGLGARGWGGGEERRSELVENTHTHTHTHTHTLPYHESQDASSSAVLTARCVLLGSIMPNQRRKPRPRAGGLFLFLDRMTKGRVSQTCCGSRGKFADQHKLEQTAHIPQAHALAVAKKQLLECWLRNKGACLPCHP